jgi:hypothetical protein
MGSLEVLTAMITPAVLISASGTLVLSTSNRLSRVVERVRILAKEVAALQHSSGAGAAKTEREFIVRQVRTLTGRARLLRTAMTILYAAIGLFIATSIAVGVIRALGVEAGWVPVALALLGTGALLHASWLLVREARLAVISTLEETAALEALISDDDAESNSNRHAAQ